MVDLFDNLIPLRSEYNRSYHQRNRERILARKRQYEQENKERRQLAKLKYRYGMSEADIDAMYLRQDGRCGACTKQLLRGGNRDSAICVDHNHRTGQVRGLLCRSCNTMLGYARDNVETLIRAADYLRNGGCK